MRKKLTEASAFAQIQGLLEQAAKDMLVDEYDGLLNDVARIVSERQAELDEPIGVLLPAARMHS